VGRRRQQVRQDHRPEAPAVGRDEGFFCGPNGGSDFTENCSEGVDTVALANLEDIDAMSFHLYADKWGKDAAWGTQWIARHIRAAHSIRERVILGEFGWSDRATRNPTYKAWTDELLEDRGAGALYWLLSDKQDDGTLYPDFDGFTVYCPSPVCAMFTNFARRIQNRLPFSFAPVADNDAATTPNNTPTTLDVTANDVTYQDVPLDVASVDLDPATPGQQTQLTTQFGTYSLQAGGDVLFAPASPCISGNVVTPYTRRCVSPGALRETRRRTAPRAQDPSRSPRGAPRARTGSGSPCRPASGRAR
jgi:mannan endo-1,4-beta-mannosidase